MGMYKFVYRDYDQGEARRAAMEFAKYVDGKIYNDEFNSVYLVFWGPGSEKLENNVE